MYNIDFSIASVILLTFLLIHYHTQHSDSGPLFLFFSSYVTLILVLAILDILDVVLISTPTVPLPVATVVCSLYLAVECIAVAAFTFSLPVLIPDATVRERRTWKLLMIPAYVVAFVTIVISFPTGVVFTIGPTAIGDASNLVGRGFVPGPANGILIGSDVFYLIATVFIVVRNRRRIDRERYRLMFLLVGISIAGLTFQQVLFEIRVSVFALTLLSLAMYLGFQVPEQRYDSLTGLLKRKGFYEEAERILREHPDEPHVLIYANISEFKAINDLYGMQVGDEILGSLGHLLQGHVNGRGVAGRLQGDHFAFLVNQEHVTRDKFFELTSEQEIERAVGRRLRIVFGIYRVNDPTVPVSRMCDCARLAMKTIEASQVENYAYYSEDMRRRFLREHELSTEMPEALQNGQFEVYLQPVVDARTRNVAAAEALIRWNHPEQGMIPPGDFVPVFENNGLITGLDHFVWESVCRQMHEWRMRGLMPLPVSVNISAMDLGVDLGNTIVGLVQKYDIEPSLLHLEITESAFTAYRSMLSEFLDFIHSYGFIVLMDDFGTGYSSLTSLKNANFDKIKMDKEFIDHMMDDERSFAVVATTVELAGKLGMGTVAEGVESERQADILSEMGVESLQGYLYSKPIPMPVFEERYLVAR